MFFADGDARDEKGIYGAFAADVVDVEHVVVRLLCGAGGLSVKWARGFGIHFERGHRYAFFFGIAQGGERAAIDAACVDVDGGVEPFGMGHGGMSIDDGGCAAISRRPVEADGQAKFVGLASGFAIECEGAHGARGAPGQFFFHSCVCNYEVAIVEYVVADEAVEEFCIAFAVFNRI